MELTTEQIEQLEKECPGRDDYIMTGTVKIKKVQGVMKVKYKETNGIPICPYCQKPTKRIKGQETSTVIYFPPTYDEEGKIMNSDRNIYSYDWQCLNCGKEYTTVGNLMDGFVYEEI